MSKRLTRNYSDEESRNWWKKAEEAAANVPTLVASSHKREPVADGNETREPKKSQSDADRPKQ